MSATRYILTFLLKILPFAALFTVIYVSARLLSLKKEVRLSDEIVRLLLYLSVVAILSQTLTPSGSLADFRFEISRTWDYYNLIPFTALRRLITGGKGIEYFFIVNVLGNIGIFMPVGFLYLWLHRSGIWRATLAGGALSVFIELFQILLPRTTDVDDVLMNTLGTLLGALAAAAVLRLAGRRRNKTIPKEN